MSQNIDSLLKLDNFIIKVASEVESYERVPVALTALQHDDGDICTDITIFGESQSRLQKRAWDKEPINIDTLHTLRISTWTFPIMSLKLAANTLPYCRFDIKFVGHTYSVCVVAKFVNNKTGLTWHTFGKSSGIKNKPCSHMDFHA